MAPPRLKAAVERFLVGLGGAKFARLYRRSDTLVVAYHNIVPRGEAPVGERSLHLGEERFGDQLDYLGEFFDVIPLESLFNKPRGGRPRVSITFDDAYLGATTVGLSQLARRKLPATIFVAPGILGRQSMWWDEFADPATGELSSAFRAEALSVFAGDNDRIRSAAASRGLQRRAMPEWATTSTEDEIAAIRREGVSLGAHSWSHPNLSALPALELARELSEPKAWLARVAPGSVPLLAYPYGLSSPAVEEAARMDGYTAAFRVLGGWMGSPTPDKRHRLPRYNVPSGMSPDGFALRSVGW